jgi:hypothetical protein
MLRHIRRTYKNELSISNQSLILLISIDQGSADDDINGFNGFADTMEETQITNRGLKEHPDKDHHPMEIESIDNSLTGLSTESEIDFPNAHQASSSSWHSVVYEDAGRFLPLLKD